MHDTLVRWLLRCVMVALPFRCGSLLLGLLLEHGRVDGSWTCPRDGGILRPWGPDLAVPEEIAVVGGEEDDDEDVADWTDDEPHLEPARTTPDAAPDYMGRIRETSDHQVLGALTVLLGIMGELWEDGHTALVGALADFFLRLDVEDYGAAASMSFAVVRRYSAKYREWHVGMPLPHYWQQWAEVAVSRVVDDATFQVELANATTPPEVGCGSVDAVAGSGQASDAASDDHVSLMQQGGRRLTVVERLIRPSRPMEWMDIMARLSHGSRAAADRVKSALRMWLSRRVNRIGHLFFTLGLMLRDTLHATDGGPSLDAEDAWVREVTEPAVAELAVWFERRCLHGHEVNLPFLVQECLRQAVRIDELDTSLFDPSEELRLQRDIEEVSLMFRVGNMVRQGLGSNPEVRAGRVRRLIQEVRALMGSEARHLRRLGICLHGLQMVGSRGVPAGGAEDSWLPQMLDDIHLLAAAAQEPCEMEVGWEQEVLELRRWLAEDRLSAEDFDGDGDDGAAPHAETEGDEVNIMQRGGGRPPWERRWWEKTPPRSRTTTSSPRRRRTGARTRSRSRRTAEEAERRDRETNAHRPWRTEARFGAEGRREPAGARVESCSSARARTGHPAEARLPGGSSNLGIHAWHAILDMVDPMTAPANITYGMVAHQMDNLEATLSSMSPTERAHMLCSFLQMLALLVTDVAGVAERVLATDDVVEVIADVGDADDGDETHLMERYVVSRRNVDQVSRGSASVVQQVFQAPAEMELRALVSALELGEPSVARARARAMLQRTRMRFGIDLQSRNSQPQLVLLLESALLTFLPEHSEVGPHDEYAALEAQDKDFVEYWWGLLYRQLATTSPSPASSGVAVPSGSRPDQFEVTEEELEAIRVMEREAQQCHLAAEEFAAYQDSQDQVPGGHEALGDGRVRVCLQGGVEHGPVQSMSWTMAPGQSLQLRLQLDQHEPDRQSIAVQVGHGGCDVATQTEHKGVKRSCPVDGVPADSTEREGCAEAEMVADGRADESEGVPDLKGDRGTGHRWRSVLRESAMVTIEDSQLPE